jgi:hypothetical protein
MSNYEPELGQACFGQPWQQHTVTGRLDWALTAMAEIWNVARDDGNPFSNSGASHILPNFEIQAYSWGDDEQPYNLAWRDVRISWYKHCGRGATVNRAMADHEVVEMLREFADCLLRTPA